jgi:hypothetical protein
MVRARDTGGPCPLPMLIKITRAYSHIALSPMGMENHLNISNIILMLNMTTPKNMSINTFIIWDAVETNIKGAR